GTWIEIETLFDASTRTVQSSTTRGTWIEMWSAPGTAWARPVGPHAGVVDRNLNAPTPWCWPGVSAPTRGTWIEIGRAMYAETATGSSPTRGTWIEIEHQTLRTDAGDMSSPTRGTWIEIQGAGLCRAQYRVVPHAGDVDRNITSFL